MKKGDIEKIKTEYEPLRKKYSLPSFSKLNEEFEIEKIQERETEFLLREIRRAVSEKIVAFLRFLELFLNPQAAPLFVLTTLKKLTPQEKEDILEIYKLLVKIELSSVSLDISYDEKKEAEFILNTSKVWNESKPKLKKIASSILTFQEDKFTNKNKTYFG